MGKNRINVYKFCGQNGSKSFLYSVSNKKFPMQYSYFMLTEVNGQVTATKINNVINFLQIHGLNIKSITEEDPDYKDFISLFSSFIRNGEVQNKPKDFDKKLTYFPSFSVEYPHKKK